MRLKEEFQRYGFAIVNYPSHLFSIVEELMESWKAFCALPLPVKSRFIFTEEDKMRLDGTGYEFKDEVGETKDRKENFHFTIRDMSRLDQISREVGIDPNFTSRARFLLVGLRHPLCNFVTTLERELGIVGVRSEVNDSWDTWYLRLLHYPAGEKEGEVIAAHHVDKLGLTMYLGETTSGVQYYTQEKQWTPMPVLSNKMFITPNMQMQYRTQGNLTALYHRVVATEDCVSEGRYSIVCFVNLVRTPQYDKRRHGRLQDMPLAFNYGMNHADFSKFFE